MSDDGTPAGAAEGAARSAGARLPAWVWQLGVAGWSFVGAVAALAVVVTALAAVSEVTLPLVLAALVAVEAKPWADALRARGLAPAAAAGGVTIGLLVIVCGVVVAAVLGVVDQAGQIDRQADHALERAEAELAPAGEALAATDRTVRSLAPLAGAGVLTQLVAGVGTLVGFASGVILGALVMYYLIKDGARLRRAVVDHVAPGSRAEVQGLVADACDVLRHYWRGRMAISMIVAAVIGLTCALLRLPMLVTIVAVNLVGGFVPYLGAFVGGGLAVVVALAEGGMPTAAVVLALVLAANLVVENLVEPKVMGGRLGLHPLVVLVVTALGGVVGGVAGLVLAVPVTAVLVRVAGRFRRSGAPHVAASIEIIRRG